jgi:hypothetical protein
MTRRRRRRRAPPPPLRHSTQTLVRAALAGALALNWIGAPRLVLAIAVATAAGILALLITALFSRRMARPRERRAPQPSQPARIVRLTPQTAPGPAPQPSPPGFNPAGMPVMGPVTHLGPRP